MAHTLEKSTALPPPPVIARAEAPHRHREGRRPAAIQTPYGMPRLVCGQEPTFGDGGESVAGIRTQEFPEPDVKAIRERTGLSQTHFAHLIGVKPKTLQNWEQHRVRPAGPARALLKIVEANPNALAALHD